MARHSMGLTLARARRAGAGTFAVVFAATSLTPLPSLAQSSTDTTTRLIELLIEKGVLTKDQAGPLLQQARSEAAAQRKATTTASRKSTSGNGTVAAGAATGAAAGASAAAAAAPTAPAVSPGTVRVTYVPQIVRDQIAGEVRQQVMQQAKTEGWAEPNTIPDWTRRITVYGDLRVRGEEVLQNKGNYPFFPDFNAIDTGSPFDTSGNSGPPPFLNTTENRSRLRIRARLGVEAKIDDWITSNIRIATGNDNRPVSTNQTLGQNTNFGKYALWVDQAYFTLKPIQSLQMYLGREPNPFWTTNLMYADELNFDGASLQFNHAITSKVGGFLNAGAFTFYNTDFNFASTSTVKTASQNKYLFGVQGGVDWKITQDYATKWAVGYFDYQGAQGKLSSPCLLLYATDSCNTDPSRPQWQQFGNTVFPIRNLLTNVNSVTLSNLQYYGLASNFGVLDVHGRVDFTHYDPIDVRLEGDYVKNLAFNKASIISKNPPNNFSANGTGPWTGGNTGYMVRLEVGHTEINNRWDWNTWLAYKYLETDAVLDGLTDPDFHLGGTNAKGFILGGNLGIARNTYLTARWLSASEVSGVPYRNDVLQLDLNAKF